MPNWISEDVTRPNKLLYRKEFLAGFIRMYISLHLYIYVYIVFVG